jgi:hypothetical protein
MGRGAKIFGTGALVTVAGLVGCTGGSGATPSYNDNYDSREGSRESPGPTRERPDYSNEQPDYSNERARTNQFDRPPGLKVGGPGANSVSTGSFKCAGVYVCAGSDKDTDNISLAESGGKCRASGSGLGGVLTLEPDGTVTAIGNAKTNVVIGSWSTSGNTLTFQSAQVTSICTPRTTTTGSGQAAGGG